MIRSLIAVLMILASPLAAQEVGDTEPVNCPLPLMWDGEVEGETFSCGVVHVPENHDIPDGRLIELAYIKLHATTLSPAPDPLIYLSGGPGGSAQHEIATNQVLHLNMQAIRERRDIIFFDQRGTGYSQLLACGPFNAAIGVVGETMDLPGLEIETLEALNASETDSLLLTLAACGTGLQSAGVDLAQYNSVASSLDIAMLAGALGYAGDYNLYGTSYGTRLALNALRTTPDNTRAVVLDGTVPPDTRGTAETTVKTYEQYESIFRLCALDAYCSERFPNARADFVAMLDSVADDPMVFDPPIVPSAFIRLRFSTIDTIDPAFFAEFALLNNGGLQGGLAAALPILVDAIAARDEGKVRDILGRGEAPAAPPQPSATDLTADDSFIAPPISLILGRSAASAEANAAGGLNQEWMSVVITEFAARLQAGETQAEVIRDAVELSLVPFSGTDPDALITFANDTLSPEAAATANALAGAMDRIEVRETMWAIQDMAERMSRASERSGVGISMAMLFNINCAEELGFTSVEYAQEQIAGTPFPGVITQSIDYFQRMKAACAFFPAPFEEAEMLAPVTSDTPALIFQQAMDTQTVLSLGHNAAQTLPNSFLLEWNSEGHVIASRSTDGCAGDIAAAFLDDPTQEPSTACARAPLYQLPFQGLIELIEGSD